MKNEVIFDNRGIPDIMVSFTPDELGLPAELRGRKVEAYLIGKYPATLIDGVPHSLPYQQPAVNINYDEAIRLCEAKGPGWHLITNDEWAALAHQSRKNGTLPRGNTNSGKSHSHPEEIGTTYPDSYGKTLTGSGPVTWNHDGTAEGVADMCGNIWEHVGGIRFVDGQVQVIPDNGAAAGADQSKDSKEWTPLYSPDGDTIYYNVENGRIKLRPIAPDDQDYGGVCFTELDGSLIDVPEKLIELGLYPAPGYDGTDYFWLDTDGERCVYRGGSWLDGASAGVFDLGGFYSRSYSNTDLGFRSAFVRYSGDSGDLDNLDAEDGKQTDKPKENTAAPSLDALAGSVKLPTLVRLILARQLTVLYEAAGGKDPEGFKRIAAHTATDKELQQAAALALPLSQVNAAVELYQNVSQQLKIANTLTVTIGKEAADHE